MLCFPLASSTLTGIGYDIERSVLSYVSSAPGMRNSRILIRRQVIGPLCCHSLSLTRSGSCAWLFTKNFVAPYVFYYHPVLCMIAVIF
jgi:hypothetical protein